jgi:hypothetical protein
MTRLQGSLSETTTLAVWLEDGTGTAALFCGVCELVDREAQATHTPITKNKRAKNGFIVRL